MVDYDFYRWQDEDAENVWQWEEPVENAEEGV
jgi:hypothetical protein